MINNLVKFSDCNHINFTKVQLCQGWQFMFKCFCPLVLILRYKLLIYSLQKGLGLVNCKLFIYSDMLVSIIQYNSNMLDCHWKIYKCIYNLAIKTQHKRETTNKQNITLTRVMYSIIWSQTCTKTINN